HPSKIPPLGLQFHSQETRPEFPNSTAGHAESQTQCVDFSEFKFFVSCVSALKKKSGVGWAQKLRGPLCSCRHCQFASKTKAEALNQLPPAIPLRSSQFETLCKQARRAILP